jgi:hypothetical protein
MNFEWNRLITIPPDASPFNNTRSTQYYHDTTRFSIVLSQYHRSSTIYLRHHLVPNRLLTPPINHHLITTVPDPPPFNYITRPTRFKRHHQISNRLNTAPDKHHQNTILPHSPSFNHDAKWSYIAVTIPPHPATFNHDVTRYTPFNYDITKPLTVSSRSYEISHRFISLIFCTKLRKTLIIHLSKVYIYVEISTARSSGCP